jgi:hypothetical protein
MSTLESSDAATDEARKDAAATLSAASSAIKPTKTGIGQKIALAGMAVRLARRYPIPALIIGGIALAYYMSHRHADTPVTRH